MINIKKWETKIDRFSFYLYRSQSTEERFVDRRCPICLYRPVQ